MPFYYRDIIHQVSLSNDDAQVKEKFIDLCHLSVFIVILRIFIFQKYAAFCTIYSIDICYNHLNLYTF